MSGRSSPVNGGYEAANVEPAMRLTVRKDLFPEVRLPKLVTVIPDGTTIRDELGNISCVKLETDFEQSIDDIANQKLQVANGMVRSLGRYRHRKHKQHSKRESKSAGTINGFIRSDKRRKNSPRNARPHRTMLPSQNKGGKNLSLVSSSEYRDDEDDEEEESSEDEVLKCSVKLPLISMPRQSGTGHTQGGAAALHPNPPDIALNNSLFFDPESVTQQLDIAIKQVSQRSVTEVGQRKSKKKKASTPVVSESSGEEYDPTRGDTAASMSVAAPKPRHSHAKTRRSNAKKIRLITQDEMNVLAHRARGPVLCQRKYYRKYLIMLYQHKAPYQQLLAHWKVSNVPWITTCLAEYSPDLVELSVAGWDRLTPEHLYELLHKA
ncbi:hypothetical protein EVAR_56326_1 [Eumeta japonica]|uniref:Uncharacterized protein n=1 Tax=Eumeta variegata TaxID=151549 RepID=A0A4C1YGT3_EUMVA|nr:hypothetical protein EVAR_56326_1 [Eumeta japonica]